MSGDVRPCLINPANVHDYQPRYDDTTNVEATNQANFFGSSLFGSRKPTRIADKTWIGDVCTYCGHFKPRPA